MKKALIWSIAVVFILSLTFVGVGCKEEAVEEAAEEAAPAEEAAEEAAPAEEAAEEVVVVSGEGRAEGMKIWACAGGTEGDPVATILLRAYTAAAEDYGFDLITMYAEWNPANMLENYKLAIASGADGIVLNGIPGEEAMLPIIEEAYAEGIVLTILCNDLPNIREKYKGQGMGFAGTDLYSSGVATAQHAVELYDLGPGDRGMVWGLIAQETRGLRSRGNVDGLKDAGLEVDYIEISDDINADPGLGVPTFASYYSTNPDVDIVIIDHGNMTATAGAYAEAAGLEPGDVQFAGYDLSPAAVDAIQSGYLGFVFDQQLWYQAYACAQQLVFTELYQMGGVYTDTGSGFIDASNIDDVIALVEQGIR